MSYGVNMNVNNNMNYNNNNVNIGGQVGVGYNSDINVGQGQGFSYTPNVNSGNVNVNIVGSNNYDNVNDVYGSNLVLNQNTGGYNNNNYNNNVNVDSLKPIVGSNMNNNYSQPNFNLGYTNNQANMNDLAPIVERSGGNNNNNNNNYNIQSNNNLAPNIERNIEVKYVSTPQVDIQTNVVKVDVKRPDGVERGELTDHYEDFILCGVPYPILTEGQALAALIVNIFFPGLGTQIVGCMYEGKCCFWYWIGNLIICYIYLLYIIGYAQGFLAPLIVGYVWAMISSCKIMTLAKMNTVAGGVVGAEAGSHIDVKSQNEADNFHEIN